MQENDGGERQKLWRWKEVKECRGKHEVDGRGFEHEQVAPGTESRTSSVRNALHGFSSIHSPDDHFLVVLVIELVIAYQ